MARTIETRIAPSQWASYLISGDESGTPEEREACDRWIESEGMGAPVSCEDYGFMWKHDACEFALAADCQTYTFLVEDK